MLQAPLICDTLLPSDDDFKLFLGTIRANHIGWLMATVNQASVVFWH